jgi:DNA-directed RNA polymerase specialized sigma subunit
MSAKRGSKPELLAAGREGLVAAARSFDPAKGKFSAWASIHINDAIWSVVRGKQSEWFPDDEAPPPMDGDKLERVYE